MIWERQATRALVAGLLEAARTGRGGSVFVSGGPGFGKTTLLEEAVASALTVPRMRAGVGRGDGTEMTVPFGVLGQAIRGAGGPALRLAPPGDRLADREHFYRVLRWLDDLTEPLLIALDDLQWADPDSLALLSFVSRRIAALPVGLVGTMRPWPEGALKVASALARDGAARLEELHPLSLEGTAALLADRLGRPVPEPLIARVWERCAGNPLLIEHVAVAIQRGRIGTDSDGDWSGLGPGGLLLTRFAGLPPAALSCARAASLLGGRFRFDLAAEVAGLADAEVDPALEALCRTGLFVPEASGGIRFVHDVFAQALYDDLPGPLRARLHARCFRVLDRHGLVAEASEHALRAGLSGNPEIVAALESAGQAALASGAPATAASQLGAAVRLAGERAGVPLLLAHGEALLRLGEASAAARAYELALARSGQSRDRRATALHRLGRALHAAGDHAAATDCLRQASDLLTGSDPDRAADVLLEQALALRFVGAPAACLPLVEHARVLAGASEVVRTRAEAIRGFIALTAGDPAGFAATAAAARQVEPAPDAEPADWVWTWGLIGIHGLTAAYLERYQEAADAFRRLRRVAQRLGAAEALMMSLTGEAEVAARRGRLGEALALVRRADELAAVSPAGATHANVVHALVLLHLDRPQAAEDACGRLEALLAGRDECTSGAWLLHLRALGHLSAGRSAAASELYLQAESLCGRLGVGEPCVVPWAADAVRAHLRTNRRADARRVVAWLEDRAAALPCRWPRIAASLGRAGLAASAGDVHEAAQQYRSALALHGEVDLPLDRTAALVAYGGFLCRSRQATAARPVLAEALRTAERTGAVWLAGQARSALRLAGGGRRRRDAAASLTPQEQQVVRLARQGLSRREIARTLFLSEGTVRSHLQHIYAKLGIHSLRELLTLDPEAADRRAQAE